MSQQNEHPSPTESAAATAPVDAATLIAQVRAMREQIPDYTQLPTGARRNLAVVAGTNPDFVRASINSVAESLNVEQALGRTPEDLRQETVDAQGWTDLEDEIRALLQGVVSGNMVKRNRIGEAALAAYAIARRLSRQKQHANLLPHVETMRRLNRFGVKKAKASVPATRAPLPEPQPVADKEK
jgi:hypothetical protein